MEQSREHRESDRTVLLKSMAKIEGLVEFDVEVISKRRIGSILNRCISEKKH